MPVYQPSLWDNIELESGYHSLSALHIADALQHFKEAQQLDREDGVNIETAIAACEYWKDRIPASPKPGRSPDQETGSEANLAQLLKDYAQYPFTFQLRKFKESLLQFMVDRILREKIEDFEIIETAFDLLLESKNYPVAEELMLAYLKNHPDYPSLLYYLAQVQWLGNKKSEARTQYARALLLYPDPFFISRIEMEELTILIEAEGMETAPVFGFLKGILPSVMIEEGFEWRNEAHKKAVQSYHLVLAADKYMLSTDVNLKAAKRKELKKVAPLVYEEYISQMGRRFGERSSVR